MSSGAKVVDLALAREHREKAQSRSGGIALSAHPGQVAVVIGPVDDPKEYWLDWDLAETVGNAFLAMSATAKGMAEERERWSKPPRKNGRAKQ